MKWSAGLEKSEWTKRYDNIDVMITIRGIGNKTINICSPTEDIKVSPTIIDEIIAKLAAIITELYIYPAQQKQEE